MNLTLILGSSQFRGQATDFCLAPSCPCSLPLALSSSITMPTEAILPVQSAYVPHLYAKAVARITYLLRTWPFVLVGCAAVIQCGLITAWLSIPLRLPSVAHDDPKCEKINYWLFFFGFFGTYCFTTALSAVSGNCTVKMIDMTTIAYRRLRLLTCLFTSFPT